MKEIYIFSTPGKPSLAHQEVVSDIMYEPHKKKRRSLTAANINASDNGKLSSKITIKKERDMLITLQHM